MTPEAKDQVTRRIALQLQIALTAWHELYPDDSDADACSKSLDLVEFEIEDFLTRPDSPAPQKESPAPDREPENSTEPTSAPEKTERTEPDEDVAELEAVSPPRQPSRAGRGVSPRSKEQRGPIPFRQMLIEIGREYPGGLDITTIIDEAQARGWSHPNPRNYVSITASQLVRGGLLVRRERGTYALSPAFMGGEDGEDAAET